MKKLIIAILSLFIATQSFGKQICKEFEAFKAAKNIQNYIDRGYTVVSMVYLNKGWPTVIVIFKEDKEIEK
jgi:hypothetical protein